MAAGQLVVPRRRRVVGGGDVIFDNPRRDFDPYHRNGKNGYHGSSRVPPHFEIRRNGFSCGMEERGEGREPSPKLEDGEIAVCNDEKGPELQPKKRKFSPIAWDVEEKKFRVSSKNRVYPTSTTQSSPPCHPQTVSVLNENSAQALVDDTGLECPVIMSPLSPQDDQEHGQVEEAQEEEVAQVLNISLSRWASESDSPRDVAVFHDVVSVGSVGRIKSTSGSDETDHSGGSTCKDDSQSEAEKDLRDIDVQGESIGVEHIDSGDDTPQMLSDDDMNGDTEGNLNMLHGCREVDEYERLNEINEGTYGKVYRARDRKTGEIVALKKVKMDAGGCKNLEEYGFPITSLREINILLSMKHPSIVNVKGVVTGARDSVFMVMECMEHDLKDLMQVMKQPFSTSEVKCLMLQLLEGVKFLHDNWVLHRDLKTSNLLFNNKGDLKICDFGMSRRYSSPLKTYTSLVVTLWYRAPELLLGSKQYSTAIDMWSAGCIMAELLTKDPLFKGKRELDQLDKIFRTLGTPNETVWPAFSRLPGAKANFVKQPYNRLREKIPATYFTVSSVLSDSGFDLLSKLLTYDPEKRITADEALNHAWFREVPLPKSKEFMPTFPPQCTKKKVTGLIA